MKIHGVKIKVLYSRKEDQIDEKTGKKKKVEIKKEVELEPDGLIKDTFGFEADANLLLEITCPNSDFGVYQTLPKTTKLQKAKAKYETDDKLVFVASFALLPDQMNEGKGWLYPRMRHNNSNTLRVVKFENERFTIYEVGLCCQNEKIFLRCQLTRRGKATAKNFLKVMEVKVEPNKSGDPIYPHNLAYCMWFNDLSGTGCFKTRDRTIRMHWTEICEATDRFTNVRGGQWVVFVETRKPAMQTRFAKEVRRGALVFNSKPNEDEIRAALVELDDIYKPEKTKESAFSRLNTLFQKMPQRQR